MTVRCNILDVLRVFPRYTGDKSNKCTVRGRWTYTCAHLASERQKRDLRKWIGRMEDASCRPPIRWVDVTGDDLVLMHCSVYFKKLWGYARRAFVWQYRKRDLPVVARMDGLLFIWNGTHRTTVCRLAGRPLRARLFNVDQFRRWERARGNRK